MPMRTIGMLLGIPEEDQERIRDRIDAVSMIDDGVMPEKRDADTSTADYHGASANTSTGEPKTPPTTS